MRDEKRIKAVLFDFDDTLITWENINISSWREFNRPKFDSIHSYLSGEGHELPDPDEFALIMHTLNYEAWEKARQTWEGVRLLSVLCAGLERCGINPAEVDKDALLEAYNWQHIPGVVPFPDTHDVLGVLKSQGYKIGLVTNSYQPMWMRDIELNKFELMQYIDARITSGDTGFMKPHPAIYWRMLGLLNLTPEEAVFVGDRPANDIQGANNVGMLSVLMSPPYLDHPLDGAQPDYTISRLSELLPILEALD
ncbi:MAG: HAD family hydrolase [Anaerolineales bacterium]|nr:HAD family hydrolase [Anaerolineales bacterium]